MLEKVKGLLSDAAVYWKKPPKGRYINYRSIFSYSVGGIGFYCIMFLYGIINVTSTNVVISNATGIGPNLLLIMQYVTFGINIFFTGVRAKIIDNARNAKGKYRPYILSMGIPTAIISCAIVWMPYEKISSLAVRWAIAFILNLALQFFYNFMYEAYENLIFVMSPNTQERADVSSVKSVVYSFAPTVLQPLIPLLVRWMNLDDMYDIRIYRAMFPPAAVAGIALTILVFAYTEENIVQAKSHAIQVRFFDALRAVAKNKYFWIISLAGWIGFLESNNAYILGWLYNYAKMCTDAQYALITLIYGNASLWGMLGAPFAIRKWGKKNVLIVTNLFNILFIGLMWPSINTFHSIWLVLICLYMNSLVGSFAHILNPTINADIRDYQHYISGERIDGMFSAVGLIGALIGLATGTVTPAIFNHFGINEHNGYPNAYDILKDNPDTLSSLINLLILLSVVGAALNVIPYFFYDLSETKQKGMIRILKIRALFEDFGNGVSRDADLVEAVELIRTVKANAAAEPYKISKDIIEEAKKSGDREAVKAAKKEYRRRKEFNEDIEVSKIVMEELRKFSDPAVQEKLARAKETYAAGLSGVLTVDDDILVKAKAMNVEPGNAVQKRIKKDCIEEAKIMLRGKRTALKNYPDGIPNYDTSVFKTLFDRLDSLDEKRRLIFMELNLARDKKDVNKLSSLKNELKQNSAEKKKTEKLLKDENLAYSVWNRSVKAYTDAAKLIAQERDYERFDEVEALYDDAKARNDARIAEEAAQERKLEEERKAEKAALKAAKAEKKHKR